MIFKRQNSSANLDIYIVHGSFCKVGASNFQLSESYFFNLFNFPGVLKVTCSTCCNFSGRPKVTFSFCGRPASNLSTVVQLYEGLFNLFPSCKVPGKLRVQFICNFLEPGSQLVKGSVSNFISGRESYFSTFTTSFNFQGLLKVTV